MSYGTATKCKGMVANKYQVRNSLVNNTPPVRAEV